MQEIKDILKNKKIISVGDRIGFELLKSDIKPDIVIFDLKEKRNPVDEEIKNTFNNLNYFSIEIDNPPSCITEELWKAIKVCLELNKKTKIKIYGEEDLSVLPIIIEANEGTIILYGLRNKGFILVEVNKDLKNEFEKLLTKFEGR